MIKGMCATIYLHWLRSMRFFRPGKVHKANISSGKTVWIEEHVPDTPLTSAFLKLLHRVL